MKSGFFFRLRLLTAVLAHLTVASPLPLSENRFVFGKSLPAVNGRLLPYRLYIVLKQVLPFPPNPPTPFFKSASPLTAVLPLMFPISVRVARVVTA